MTTAGSIVVDLLMRTGSFVTDTQRAEKQLRSLQKTAASAADGIGKGFVALAGVIGGVIGGVLSVSAAIDGLSQAIDSADRLDELSARFGVSTEKLSEWGYAAKLTGSDLESLSGVIPKFSKLIAEAADSSSEAGKTFAALGISVKDQFGQLRSFEDLLPEVADRFKGITNETTKTALAVQLFGRSGAEFLEFLSLGSSGLKDMGDRARDLGIVIDGKTAASAAAFKDELDNLRAATQGWMTVLAAELLPTMTELTTELVEFIKQGGGVRDIAHSIAEGFHAIADAAQAFGAVETFLDRVRGGLVGLEKQGNAAFKAITGQAYFTGDTWSSLKDQYNEGSAYIANGYAAMQPRAAESSDPGRRRNAANIPSVQELKDYAAEQEKAAAAQDRLNKLWATGSGASKASGDARRLAKSLAEITKVEREWQTELDGTGNPVMDAYARRLDEITSKAEDFTRNGVPTEKVAEFRKEMTALAERLKSKETTDYLEEFSLRTAEMAASLDGPAAAALVQFQRGVRDLDKEMKAGLISQDDYKARLQALQDQQNGSAIQMIRDLQYQNELLGKSADEQEIINALHYAGVEAQSAYGQQIVANIKEQQQMRAVIQDQVSVMDEIRDAGKGFIVDLAGGASPLKALEDGLERVYQKVLAIVAENLMESLFGKSGDSGGGSWGDAIGSIIGSFFGQSGSSGGRAGGGPVAGSNLYEVGEGGRPELLRQGSKTFLIPGSDGTITPATAGLSYGAGSGGAADIYINTEVNVSSAGAQTSTSGDSDRMGRAVSDVVSSAVKREILQMMRPGGLLSGVGRAS